MAVNHTFCSTLESDIALSDDNDTVLHPVQGCRSGWAGLGEENPRLTLFELTPQ